MTSVFLLETPFDSTGKHLLLPKGKTKEDFLNEVLNVYPHKRYDNVTWERENQSFRCPVRYDKLEKYNYMAYQNGSDIQFAYITSYTYINNSLTYVNCTIDYWATYFSCFSFHPSPIVRQHPDERAFFGKWTPEPVQIDRFVTERTNYDTDDNDIVYLLTANNSNTYQNRSSDFYGMIAQLAAGDSTAMTNFYTTVQTTPCECGGVVQTNTSVVTRSQALEIVKQYAQCGRQEDVLGAYHIPKFFQTSTTGTDLSRISNVSGEITFKQEYKVEPLWEKIYQSPQFNKLTVNLYGNAKDYDFRYFDDDALYFHEYTFKWAANQSQLGGAIISPEKYADGLNGDFSLASSTWDTVQLSTTQLNNAGIARDTGKFGIALLTNAFSLDIRGVAQSVEDFAENMGNRYENTDITIGNPTGTIALYNALFPALSLAWYHPSDQDIDKLNLYFCMYGYNYNGALSDINLNNLPIVNYVHTSGAIVTGTNCPQTAIEWMISRLDSGCFFWHGTDNYKATDKLLENHF